VARRKAAKAAPAGAGGDLHIDSASKRNGTATPNSPLGKAALLYAARFGWSVFPAPPGTKKSYKAARFSNGHRWGATNKPRVIERNFRRWPKANLGIPTGAENRFWVLDADTPNGHGVNGIAELKKLERKYGHLPETLTAISPSGGRHYYFERPKCGIVCNSASAIAPGIDVRGEGGMVLAPPSINGAAYRWLNWGTPIAKAPEWLLKLAVRRPPPRIRQSAASGCADVGLIKAALKIIPAEAYQVWFEVGCALSCELGDDGFALFDTWSATSNKYEARKCAAQWDKCAEIFAYTIATIIHYANAADPCWQQRYERQRWLTQLQNYRLRKMLPQLSPKRRWR
jgi:Bifunctional DNA primase/polymerase, N-terminal/Primase C terminal 2 (PriCT-2)